MPRFNCFWALGVSFVDVIRTDSVKLSLQECKPLWAEGLAVDLMLRNPIGPMEMPDQLLKIRDVS